MEINRDNAVAAIAKACEALGWAICVPDAGLLSMEDEIQGLIVGNCEYVNYILACLPVPDLTKH
jgi:hypothetical protein